MHVLIHGKPDQESVFKCSLSILPILVSNVNENINYKSIYQLNICLKAYSELF